MFFDLNGRLFLRIQGFLDYFCQIGVLATCHAESCAGLSDTFICFCKVFLAVEIFCHIGFFLNKIMKKALFDWKSLVPVLHSV